MQDELKAAAGMVKTPYMGKTPLLRRYHLYVTTSRNRFSEAGGNTRSAQFRPSQRSFLGPGTSRPSWKMHQPSSQWVKISEQREGDRTKLRVC